MDADSSRAHADLVFNMMMYLQVEGGYVTFRYAAFYYIFDDALINDDDWHHFEMRLITNSNRQWIIVLQLDYGVIQVSLTDCTVRVNTAGFLPVSERI